MQALKLENLEFDQKAEIYNSLHKNLTVAIIDQYGRIRYASDSFCKILGINNENIVGENNEILKSRLHSGKIYRELWSTIESGEIWNGVLPHNLSDVHNYWLQTTIIPVKNKTGGVKKYITFYNDISEYYTNDEFKSASQDNSQTIVQKFSEFTLYVNDTGKIIRATSEQQHKEYDDIVGSYIYDYINKEYHQAVKSKIKNVFELKMANKFRFASDTSEHDKALYFSQITPVYTSCGDVVSAQITTERRTDDIILVSELKAIETKYSSIFQSINAGIIVVADSQGNITEWNKGAEMAFGYTEKEILGKSLTKLIAEPYLEESIQLLLEIKENISEQNKKDTIELMGVKKCGEEFAVELAVSSWFCGKEQFFCAIMLDISNRKVLENKLKQKTKDLEHFLYRSAHDLKAPLTSIEGLINVIKEENVQDELANVIDMLDVSLRRGKLLLDNLAFASEISQKRRNLTSVNFKDEVNDTLSAVSSIEGFYEIDFKINIIQHSLFYSNRDLINSILQNLIHNAIYYRKPEREIKSQILINIEQIEGKIKISISDNGRGISKENKDKIFDLYYRVSNEGVQGTGIGLYIVKCIVENLSGTIAVTSEYNKGTTFKIEIPNLKK